ncbi:LysR substrate-binding domain-containing protein [Massilia sp. G4R7]|uniref:LysR substrate-binding domain-containing protein n=1 Tax=Massilia phyllostachyos TaxID=2898585 RepID=A0ABS8Q7Y7_9BURK|nr:LysR substrate-binding domain-containing protein [Massilia phyllostachyos]MCD2517810.1 LysR substrate-binding domain-containing protein [Massilia phyllostachyos]
MDRLTLMETFVCTVETGSFSAAARRLNVGQPAVSKAIAQLEERLLTRLLLRSTRGLTTTEAGLAYYESAKRAIAMVDEADGAARGVSADLVGKLRVCAAVTFARLHLIPHIKRFMDRHPALEVEVMLDDRQIDLLENGVDVALRMGNLGDSSMTARRITTGRRMVVATPGYLAERGVPQIPADLAQHEAVVYLQDSGGATTWSFGRDNAEVSVTVNGSLSVNAAEGVRAAVCAGVGIAIASEWMFAPELANGEVEQLLPEWSLPTIDLWAVYPSGRLASAKARAFTAFVREIIIGEATTEERLQEGVSGDERTASSEVTLRR